jgi:hypothetical protein
LAVAVAVVLTDAAAGLSALEAVRAVALGTKTIMPLRPEPATAWLLVLEVKAA